MRIKRLLSIALAIVLSGLFITPALPAQEKKIGTKDLPAAVLAAFTKAYPHARIKGASTEVEKGTTYYEIESMDGTQARDILYLADGTATEIEEVVLPAALPVPVKTAVTAEFAKVKISKAERVQRGAEFSYEVHVKLGSKSGSIVVSDSGKVLEKSPLKVKKEKKENEEEEEDD